MLEARMRNDVRRTKMHQREVENEMKAKKFEEEMRRRQEDLERRDKERQAFLEIKN